MSASASIREALPVLEAAVDKVLEGDIDALSCRELIDVLVRLETVVRRMPVASQGIIAQLSREATVADLGGSALRVALADALLISSHEAKRRIENAMVLSARVGITGEELEPALPVTAQAQAQGQIGAEQLEVIRAAMDRIPRRTPSADMSIAEAQLAGYGTQFRPEQLRMLSRRLVDTIDPDGQLDERERERRRGVTLGPQGVDGMSRLSGWITPELRANLEPGLHKWGAPGMCNPADESPRLSGTPTDAQIQGDTRSTAQRQHDALSALCRTALMSGELGDHHGLPVTVIVSATLQELQSAAGHGLTAGGTVVPMRDVIRMAGHAYHYLCLFDDATGIPLDLYRTRRCASVGQRVVLHARDRGCTYPGCTAPAYLCQVHHVEDFAPGGNTNIDDLTLVCRPHHRLVTSGGWTTCKRADGRIEWIPPPRADHGQPRTNDFHHPERLRGEGN